MLCKDFTAKLFPVVPLHKSFAFLFGKSQLYLENRFSNQEALKKIPDQISKATRYPIGELGIRYQPQAQSPLPAGALSRVVCADWEPLGDPCSACVFSGVCRSRVSLAILSWLGKVGLWESSWECFSWLARGGSALSLVLVLSRSCPLSRCYCPPSRLSVLAICACLGLSVLEF